MCCCRKACKVWPILCRCSGPNGKWPQHARQRLRRLHFHLYSAIAVSALKDPGTRLNLGQKLAFTLRHANAQALCVPDRIVVVKGRVDHKEGETKLIAIEVSPFEAIPERRDVRLRIDARRAPAGVIRELAQIVREFRGSAPVVIEMETSQGCRTLALGPDYRVEPAPDFFAEVKALLGAAAVA